MEKEEWEEAAAATADAHLISGATITWGHEKDRLPLPGWLSVS